MSTLSQCLDEALINLIEDELKKRGYTCGGEKKEQFAGSIYILVNPAFPDMVKIGYADDVEKRLKSLNRNSALPDPFHCYAAYKVKKRLRDKELHRLIDTLDPTLRHAKNREFYGMDAKKAYEVLSAIAQINGSEAQLIRYPIDKNGEGAPESTPSKTTPPKKGNLTFELLGIPVGTTLTFVKDAKITCTTLDKKNKVSFEGKTYSLSGLGKYLMKVKAIQGGLYFAYNGETLVDIRKRLNV